MNEKEILKKKDLINKYFNKKKYLCLFDMYFYNIDNLSMFIRVDYINKTQTYRVSWVNLGAMTSNKVEDWINSSLVYPSMIDKLRNIIANNGIVEDYVDKDNINSKVIINSYLINYETNKKRFEFKRYLPACWQFLADALFVIFDGMPKYTFPLFQIIIEKMIKPDINCVFVYDLEHNNFDELFENQIITRGRTYLKEDRILFLEKELDTYNSVVRGTQDYLVTITNKKETKEVQMTCTCPHNTFCKHIYATLLAIKNKKEKKFYKIAHIDDKKDIINNIKEFNYLLCVGILDDYFVVIDNLNFAFLPILSNNILNYKIVEDDDKKTLETDLNRYLKRHKVND